MVPKHMLPYLESAHVELESYRLFGILGVHISKPFVSIVFVDTPRTPWYLVGHTILAVMFCNFATDAARVGLTVPAKGW